MQNLELWIKFGFIVLVVLAVPMLMLRKQAKRQHLEEQLRRQRSAAADRLNASSTEKR